MKNQEVLQEIKKSGTPLSTKEILLELKKINKKDSQNDISYKISKFREKHLKKLEESGFIFRIQRSRENKEMLKTIFKKDWENLAHSYYVYAEYPKSRIIRKSINHN